MATSPFPHVYRVQVTGRDVDSSAGTLDSDCAPAMPCGPPPQFGGEDSWWSPEQLLLGAVGSCHMTTFLALARHAKIGVVELRCGVEAELDKTREGLRFTSIVVDMEVELDAPDCDSVQKLVGKTHRHCIVSNALNVPVEVRARVRCSGGRTMTVAA